MLPSLVMVIGVADVVHVLVEHRAAVAASSGRHEAVVETLRQVGLPCLLTSLTTAVGFGSLMLSDIPQVREFGMFAALGVLLAFLIAVIGLPALLAVLPPGRLSRPLSTAGEGRLVLLLARIDRLFPRARLPVLLTAGLVTLAGGLGLRHLRVESSALTFLPAEHSVLRDLNVVYPRLMGTTPVIVHWWDRGKGQERLRDPKILHAMDRVARAMAGVPGVRKVISITEYLKETNRVIHGGEAGQFVLPRDRRTVATYLELIEGQDPDALSAMINWDRSAANLTLMCVAHNSRAMQTILAALDRVLHSPKIARAMEDGDIVAEVTGLGPLLASVADRIVAGQLTSCFWALGIIALMFFMILWSVRVGLVALLPNVLPILFIVGLMGWLGITLNVFTVMIASIALGIAVDDTIHVLVRTRQEVRQSGDLRSAVSRTLASSGQAIVITTLVVGGGFLVMLLSVMIPAHHFGAMTALTLVMALLADLLLLPLLILWMRPWRGR
jgi:predicted RND superfamily exporter protein